MRLALGGWRSFETAGPEVETRRSEPLRRIQKTHSRSASAAYAYSIYREVSHAPWSSLDERCGYIRTQPRADHERGRLQFRRRVRERSKIT